MHPGRGRRRPGRRQAPTRWEDHTGELRRESRLLDPAEDEHVYLELELECLRLSSNRFSWIVPLDTARRLRDQPTTHLDCGATNAPRRW
ncbi:MAG: hypothetical protein ACRDSR_02585 [Pseudonocardiaceae bacterium]